MARLTALPSLDIIHGFKGILDFYLWKGLPCCRSWPYNPKSHHSEATIAAAATFGAVLKSYSLLADTVLAAYRDDAKDHTRTARDIFMSAKYGKLHQRTVPPPPPPPEEQMYNAYVCLRDLKTQGTHGGDFTSGAWRTRDLTEEQADLQDICTLADNQFTLAPGTYRCLIHCPAYVVAYHQARLHNTTADTQLLPGTPEYANPSFSHTTHSTVAGRFTIATAQTLQIQHRCTTTRNTTGFGLACNFTDEIYTIAEFWREIEA